MLKFILSLFLLFFLLRLAIRLIGFLFRTGLFFWIGRKGFRRLWRTKDSQATTPPSEHLDEADYEVIESHLHDPQK